MTSATQLPPDNLTIMQSEFIKHLFNPLIGGNVGEAAKLANYKHPKQAGNTLMHNPNVIAAIEKHKAELATKNTIDEEFLVNELLSGIKATKDKDYTNHRGYIDLGFKYKKLIGNNEANNTDNSVTINILRLDSNTSKPIDSKVLTNGEQNV